MSWSAFVVPVQARAGAAEDYAGRNPPDNALGVCHFFAWVSDGRRGGVGGVGLRGEPSRDACRRILREPSQRSDHGELAETGWSAVGDELTGFDDPPPVAAGCADRFSEHLFVFHREAVQIVTGARMLGSVRL